VAWRPPSSPSRCSARVLIGSVSPGRASRVVGFNPVRPKSGLCAMSGDFARDRVKRTQASLLFDVACSVVHSIAVAAGAAFAVPPGPQVGWGREGLGGPMTKTPENNP
jgi:hypothetical protein